MTNEQNKVRTHESVLLANYSVTQKVESGRTDGGAAPLCGWHSRKYMLGDAEVMENRFIVHAWHEKATLQTQTNALGSFHETHSLTITREQYEYLKEIWK